MRTPRSAAVAAALALSLLSACGDGDDDSGSSEKVTETVTASPTTSAPTETAVTTEATPMDPMEGDVTQEQLDAALLTPEEVAPGMVLGTWADESSPPPCDQTATPADEQVPPTIEGGTQINTSDGNASFEEEIAIYATEAEATEAFAISTAGLDCTSATFEDGSTVSISEPTDVTAEVNGDSGLGTSTAWEVSSEDFEGVLVATIAGRVIMANTFVAAPGTDTSTLPTPVEIATAAWNKAIAS